MVSLTSDPLQGRDYLVSDWLSMILWRGDSNPKKTRASIDAHHDSFTVHLFFFLFFVLFCFVIFYVLSTPADLPFFGDFTAASTSSCRIG